VFNSMITGEKLHYPWCCTERWRGSTVIWKWLQYQFWLQSCIRLL